MCMYRVLKMHFICIEKGNDSMTTSTANTNYQMYRKEIWNKVEEYFDKGLTIHQLQKKFRIDDTIIQTYLTVHGKL